MIPSSMRHDPAETDVSAQKVVAPWPQCFCRIASLTDEAHGRYPSRSERPFSLKRRGL
jgi:hypothetical protein